MVMKILLLAAIYLASVNAHSWMTCPPSFDNRIIQRGGIQGALCEAENANSPTTYVKAGDKLKVGWTSNNHAGGWVRMSLVPYGSHLNLAALKANVLKVSCFGHDVREGKTKNGDCVHPCGGRPGCEYQSNQYDINRFDTTMGIPTNLEDGDYVLQVTMLVGNSHSVYNSCAKLRITGGNPNFECESDEAILVYACKQTGGPRPEATMVVGNKRGDFCYRLDGGIGSVDDNMHHVPINVECDPRLSCLNSVQGGTCSAEPSMDDIKDAGGPFPRLEGCQHYSMLPDLPPSCNDGLKNGLETGVDCGGDCEACPTTEAPTKIPGSGGTDYYSGIDQLTQLWSKASGQINIKVHIIKEIQTSQCWQLLLQFKRKIIMGANPWGDGHLVETREKNRIITFEKSSNWKTWRNGDTLSVTFPIVISDIPEADFTTAGMERITSLFEVYDDTTNCLKEKIPYTKD